MTGDKLDYSSLEKAIVTFEISLTSYESAKNTMEPEQLDIMRDGAIQRFEYTFELAWKTIKRYLEMYGLEKVDKLNNRDLFRAGFENGLISDASLWFDYLTDRNLTSHIYDQNIASEVYDSAKGFLDDVKYLLAQLKERVT